jgi:hypothetical protein
MVAEAIAGDPAEIPAAAVADSVQVRIDAGQAPEEGNRRDR